MILTSMTERSQSKFQRELKATKRLLESTKAPRNQEATAEEVVAEEEEATQEIGKFDYRARGLSVVTII